MNSEWEVAKLGDVAKCRNGAGIKQDYFSAVGTPLARISDFTEDSIDLRNCIYIESEEAKNWQTHRLKTGDILVATVGSWPPNWSSVVGKTVRVPSSAAGAIQNQNTACILANPILADQRFLYFLLKSRDFVYYAANAAGGSANQARLAVANLEKFSFRLPPVNEQKAIAHILGALDDKIELNQQMNQILEDIARALFKSWCIDFDPVRAKLDGRQPTGMDAETAALFPAEFEDSAIGKIPKGWKTGSLLEHAELISGGTPKTSELAYWDGNIPWASAKDVSQCSETFLINTERKITDLGLEKSSTKMIDIFSSIVVARGATTGRLTMIGSDMAMNQTCYALRSRSNCHFALYCQLQAVIEDIVQTAHGSVFDTITTSTFKSSLVTLPPEEVLICFENSIKPLFLKILWQLEESRSLTKIRDSLLPKLLSGWIRVQDAEKVVEQELTVVTG